MSQKYAHQDFVTKVDTVDRYGGKAKKKSSSHVIVLHVVQDIGQHQIHGISLQDT